MNTSDKGAMSYSEGDYKRFEEIASRQRDIEPEIAEVLTKHGHELFESSEPQDKEHFIDSIRKDFHTFIPLMVSDKFKPQFQLNYVDLINDRRVEVNVKITIDAAPVESQEELWGEVISECRVYDGTPTYFLMLQKRLSERFTLTRLTP